MPKNKTNKGRNKVKRKHQSLSSNDNSPEQAGNSKKKVCLPGLGLSLPSEFASDFEEDGCSSGVDEEVMASTNKDIAALIEVSKRQEATVDKLLEQNKQLMEAITGLSTRLAAVEEKLSKMENTTTTGTGQQKSAVDMIQVLLEAQEEKAERDKKKTNFVIYGLKENREEGRSDLEIVNELFEKSGAAKESITDVFRMGDQEGKKFPRLVKVQTNSFDEKSKVVKEQKKTLVSIPEFQMATATGYSKYLRDDLTFQQRKLYFDLKEDRDERNENVENGFQWSIFNFKLVKRRIRRQQQPA